MNKRVKEFLDKSSNYEVIEYIGQLQQENKQLKDNWNELKEYISIKLYNTEYLQKLCGCRIDDIDHILLDAIREEMQGPCKNNQD